MRYGEVYTNSNTNNNLTNKSPLTQYGQVYSTPVQTQTTYAPNYYTDPNDPLALNSFADAIFNRDAKELRYGDWVNIPLVGDIASTVIGGFDVLYNNSIKPILGNVQYGFDTNGVSGAIDSLGSGLTQAGINTLVNFGETIDIIANPIKAVAIEGADALGLGDYGSQLGGDVLGGLASSVGLGGDGRRQYDWDTGNFISDLALEIVSDPVNWFTFGSSTAAKSAIDGATTASVKAATGVSDDIAQQVGKELSTIVSRGALNNPDPLPNLIARTFRTTGETGRVVPSNMAVREIFEKYNIPLTEAGSVAEDISKQAYDGVLTGLDTLVQSRNINSIANTIDDFLLKGALYTSGTGQLIDTSKAVVKSVSELTKPFTNKMNTAPTRLYKEGVDALSELLDTPVDDLGFKPKGYVDPITQSKPTNRTVLLEYQNTYRAVAEANPDDALAEHIYKSVTDVIDYANLPADPVTRVLYQKIGPLFKTGYLSTGMGTAVRNGVDAIIKNAINMGGIAYIPKAINDYVGAGVWTKNYNETLAELLDYMQKHNRNRVVDVATGKIKFVKVPFEELKFDSKLIDNFYRDYGLYYSGAPDLNQLDFEAMHRLFTDGDNIVEGMYGDLRAQLDNFRRLQQMQRMLGGFKTADPAIKKQFIEDVLNIPLAKNLSEVDYTVYVNNLIAKYFSNDVQGQTPLLRDMATAFNRQFVEDSIKFMQLPTTKSGTPETLEGLLESMYATKNTDNLLNFLIENSLVSKAMADVEIKARVSTYMEALRQGRTEGEAKQAILNTHYGYKNKTVMEKVFEAWVPFSTFTKNNGRHWYNMLYGQEYYSWAGPIKKLFGTNDADAYKIWNEMLDDAKSFGVMEFKNSKAGRKLYATGKNRFLNKYLPFGKGLSEEATAAFKQTRNEFFGFFRNYINSLSNPEAITSFEMFRDVLTSTTQNSIAVKQFAQMWLTAASPQDLTNPENNDYTQRYRPDAFTLEEDYPELTIHPSEVYRILAGNVSYGDSIQDPSNPANTLTRSLKLSPSFVDAFNFAINPIGTYADRITAPVSVPVEYLADLQDGELTKSIDAYLAEVTPIAGIVYQRMQPVPTNVSNFTSPEMLMPSLFGVTKTNTGFEQDGSVRNVTDSMLYRWYKQLEVGNPNINPYDVYPQTGDTRTISSNRYYQNYKNLYNPTNDNISSYNTSQQKIYNYARPSNLYDKLYTKSGTFRLSLSGQYQLDGIDRLFRNNYYYY